MIGIPITVHETLCLTSCYFEQLGTSLADFFFKLTFSKKSFRNTIRVSNCLDLDQDRHFVGPDLGPNCFSKDNSRQQVAA